MHICLSGLRRDIGQTLESTGLTIWRAADILSEHIYANRKDFKNKEILELGGGLGLCGILLSRFCSRITISDGDKKTIQLLQKNCSLNPWISDNISCKHLLWTCEVGVQLGMFDIVCGSDVIYEDGAVAPLFYTAKRHLRPNSDAYFLLSFTKRNISIDYVLKISQEAGLVCISHPSENGEGIYKFIHA